MLTKYFNNISDDISTIQPGIQTQLSVFSICKLNITKILPFMVQCIKNNVHNRICYTLFDLLFQFMVA